MCYKLFCRFSISLSLAHSLSALLSRGRMHKYFISYYYYYLESVSGVSCFFTFSYVAFEMATTSPVHSFACDKWHRGRRLCPIACTYSGDEFIPAQFSSQEMYFSAISLALSSPRWGKQIVFSLLSRCVEICPLLLCITYVLHTPVHIVSISKSAMRYTRCLFPVHKFIYCRHFFHLALNLLTNTVYVCHFVETRQFPNNSTSNAFSRTINSQAFAWHRCDHSNLAKSNSPFYPDAPLLAIVELVDCQRWWHQLWIRWK